MLKAFLNKTSAAAVLMAAAVALSCSPVSDSGFSGTGDPEITAVSGEMSWDWDNADAHVLTVEGSNLEGKTIWVTGNTHFTVDVEGTALTVSPVAVLGETSGTVSERLSVMVSYGNAFQFTLTHTRKAGTVTPEPLPGGSFAYSDCCEIPAVSLGDAHSTRSGVHGDDRWFNTSTADADLAVVSHTFTNGGSRQRTYTLLYDRSKRCALWAACAFNSTTFGGSVGRNEKWQYDPAIDPSDQPDLGKAYSGYSRGHQIASNDRQTTKAENWQTFYYSNMTPQKQPFNGSNWASLENKVQALGKKTSGRDTLYLVTGPVFGNGYGYTTDGSGNRCAVPTRYYKCLMLCTFDAGGNVISAKGTAYLTTGQDNTDYNSWLTTIDKVEDITGFNFFANVPEEIQIASESTSSLIL